jgi:HSP20 family molecular chaperone IbpA
MSQNNVVSKEKEANREEAALLPPVDVIEDAEGITLYADLPGVPKDRLSVRVEADTLTIEGEISLFTTQGMEATHAEVQLPRYRRAFTLGTELNSEKVGAEFRQGILKLRIPKAEHAKPRKIEVQVA